ncbi:sn-glycerol-3-phosphate ABC transporter ATP-binding protein UgpC [Marinomonas hwangdonensis]|uniref:sn-glycerol-3-phosphate ABC transporter ATP-binding protein UgpC n=1 Tax=Marinomonas hwangdonensis TaxID=1053647 RepID=A0A3M8Q4J7_9GAMM|nr:sn-glycerol-3-phosphate ABC transporter ATP-binding protein UgpC [Marinomonas hwangdonensis]RNF51049.1 sn-glycerol-3-phosphate ABC transporter ATP-binding protein UgpC [Marinomonas hwangdonensis]
MADVTLHKLVKRYDKTDIIKGVDIDIKDGEFTVFVGPSGCGKSTLLRMIAGLEDITDGTLSIDGKVVNHLQPKDRSIAMVFQSYAIFPHMTVRENMAFGLTIAGVTKEEKDRRVNEAARVLQMEHLLERRPSQLSGGQRQRVAIGRAIVRNPKVFLFDEPLSNLDASLRMDMRMEIAKLHKKLGATMIYVTHDQVEAMTLADKIVVLKEGEVQQIGSPMELFHYPANRFVAGFLGSPSMNFIDAEVLAIDAQTITLGSSVLNSVVLPRPEQDVLVGQTVELGIRPQYLQPQHGDNKGCLHGQISLTERLGTETVLDISLSDGKKVIASIGQDQVFEIGESTSLHFDPERAHVFVKSADA